MRSTKVQTLLEKSFISLWNAIGFCSETRREKSMKPSLGRIAHLSVLDDIFDPRSITIIISSILEMCEEKAKRSSKTSQIDQIWKRNNSGFAYLYCDCGLVSATELIGAEIWAKNGESSSENLADSESIKIYTWPRDWPWVQLYRFTVRVCNKDADWL